MWIDELMTPSVMSLDMFKLRRLPKRRDIPVQVPQPLMQRRVSASDIPDIALEMLDVYWIEADDGRVEADVCFGYRGAEVVGCGVLCEVRFDAVEGGEEGLDGFFVGFLGSEGGVSYWKGVEERGGKSTWRSRICRRRC